MPELKPADPVAEIIRSARLRAILRYWAEKSAGRPMPFRRQIEPTEIPGILPIALLADIVPHGARMRLLGSEATDAYGRETRDCLVKDIQLGAFSVSWQDAFLRVTRSASPAYAAGTFLRGTEICRVETVLTPLTGDGSSISQIFGGLLIRPVTASSAIRRDGAGGYSVAIEEQEAGSDDWRTRRPSLNRDYR
jgi:hypothetical protein